MAAARFPNTVARSMVVLIVAGEANNYTVDGARLCHILVVSRS